MKKNTPKDYAIALYQSTEGIKGEKLEAAIKEFAKFLVRSGLSAQSNKIIEEYVRYTKKQEGIVDINVTSARPLDTKAIDKIKKVFGNKVEVTENIDKGLIGGIKIRTEDMIFDASLKKQLQLLKQKIS